MKKIIITISVLLLLLSGFILKLFLSTGFFRKIDNIFDGKVVQVVPIPGAEDMAISYEDHFIVISSDDRAAHRHDRQRKGGLYKIDLQKDPISPKRIPGGLQKDFFPHGISMIKVSSGVYKIYAINHVAKVGAEDVMNHTGKEHSIEVFRLIGDSLIHEETLKDALVKSPNDIVAIDEHRFYFTNDHGADSPMGILAENYLGRSLANVVYFDGNTYREVAGGIAYANGINYDRKKNLLFVASPRHFTVKVYQIKDNGNLNFIENINCQTGVDNIEIDQHGTLWIGSHPNLLQFSAYAAGRKEIAPSELITIDYRSTGNYTVKSVYTNDGSVMSASSVAVVYDNYIYTGNVMDSYFLILEQH